MKWISVKDRLPKRALGNFSMNVLCFQNGFCFVGKYEHTGNRFHVNDGFLSPMTGVTHWMHLPQPPKS